MFNPYFDTPTVLLLGAITGLVFGFLLQKGGVTKYDTILGQFLLRDFTVLKVMLTAVVVGGLGVYAMAQLGWVSAMHIKGAILLSNALGGAIFGVGMAVLGYCPGTGVAAIGDGARDAIPGVLGMVVGAALFAEAYPWIKRVMDPVGDLGKVTLADLTGLSPFLLLAIIGLGAAGLFLAVRKRTAL